YEDSAYVIKLAKIDPGLNAVTTVEVDINLRPYDLKIDGDDDVIVAGALYDVAVGGTRWGVFKARPDGSLVWVHAQHLNPTMAQGHASAVFVSDDDRVFVTGSIDRPGESWDDMYTRVFPNYD